ncbi:hypothetical protein TGAM01_v200118 [Trichoderma gamsii]|uniref:Uncharacterized protein n=1 Tax=Trichoderma gamsii TaxID=398673 RepID=A0A2P5A2D5_9HYPO|nr:hypothetical protein TGAM01_v200118 [Trichoderma gamsii]PON30698.1 hypothetical protein TGAM01_v200118 [Trichoderma gamsii]
MRCRLRWSTPMAQSGQSHISQNATRAPAIPGATSQERDSLCNEQIIFLRRRRRHVRMRG